MKSSRTGQRLEFVSGWTIFQIRSSVLLSRYLATALGVQTVVCSTGWLTDIRCANIFETFVCISGVNPVAEVLDSFEIEWHGNVVVVIPAKSVESLNWDLVEQAADVIMEPLATQEVPMVVVDLKDVGYFGSVFLALLLRCHKFLKRRGGELVLCGTNEMARELLKITALDTIWAIYDTRQEAMQAIDG